MKNWAEESVITFKEKVLQLQRNDPKLLYMTSWKADLEKKSWSPGKHQTDNMQCSRTEKNANSVVHCM